MADVGIKVAIRADRPAGVIRAYFATLDGSAMHEVGTLSITIADNDRPTFEAWVAFWEGAMRSMMAHNGVEVLGFTRFRPHDKN